MHPGIRTAGHKCVAIVGRLSFEDPDLAGGEDLIHIMAYRIGNVGPGDVGKCGASRGRPGTGDRIAHSGPRKAIILGTLHTDQGRVLRIAVGNVYVRSERWELSAGITADANALRGAV